MSPLDARLLVHCVCAGLDIAARKLAAEELEVRELSAGMPALSPRVLCRLVCFVRCVRDRVASFVSA